MDLIIITGATRGYGQSIADQYSLKVQRPQEFVLMGRTVEGLEQTKQIILRNNNQAVVRHYVVDLYDAADFQKQFELVFKETMVEKYNRAVLIHNAGTIGRMTFQRELAASVEEINDIQKEYLLNITSVLSLNAHFIKKFKGHLPKDRTTIVNISSGAATRPTETWGVYCSTKASRKVLFEILAIEEKDSLQTFSYAPGIFDSKMQENIRANGADSSIKSFLTKTFNEGKMTPVSASTSFLVVLLESGGYTSGEHVELYKHHPELSPI